MDEPFFYSCKGACYPINFPDFETIDKAIIKPLVDIAAEKIVEHSSTTQTCVDNIPYELFINLMQAALCNERSTSISILIHNWPWPELILNKIVPPMVDDLGILHDIDVRIEKVKRGVKKTSNLITTFVDCLKKRSPSKLKILDLCGFPVADVMTHYICTNCLLAANESRRRSIIKQFREHCEKYHHCSTRQEFSQQTDTFPEGQYLVRFDAYIKTEDSALELIKAIKASSASTLQIDVKKLDLTCLSQEILCQLLSCVDKKVLTSLRLQYNSLTSDSVISLAPVMQEFINVTELDLSCNGLILTQRRKACDAVRNSLKLMPFIQRLDLSNCWMQNSLYLLLENVTLPLLHIGLNGTRLKKSDLEYLAASRHVQLLEELDISENDLSECGRSLSKLFLACKSTIKVIEAEECHLTDNDLDMITSLSTQLSELRFLNVCYNSFYNDETISKAVKEFARSGILQILKICPPESDMEGDYDDLLNAHLLFIARVNAFVFQQGSKLEVIVN